MKFKFAFLVCLLSSALSMANNPDIEACLSAWGETPFKKGEAKFRTIKSKVKVLGIGGTVRDDTATKEPELILVKPNVSVLTKQTYELLNPNGLYCLKGTVSVLSKSEITAHCKTRIASSDDGVSIAASDKDGTGTVSVLSKVQLTRVGCDEKKN